MTPRLWEDVLELQKQAKLKDNVIYCNVIYCNVIYCNVISFFIVPASLVNNDIDDSHMHKYQLCPINAQFLRILDETIPRGHILYRVFNRHTVKVSYRTMSNIKKKISTHNHKIFTGYTAEKK